MTDVKTYIAIDLKSFYASVECVERGLDPLTTNLVVADPTRTEKTICLAVSPSLKAHGISGRARLFEVIEKVAQVNAQRKRNAGGKFSGESYDANELAKNPGLELSYIVAPPRMAHYIECSSKVYETYLKYIAPEDMHVYSIDEVFIDATAYLDLYKMSAHDLAMKMVRDVLATTGVTATAGIGPNLYLCKVAMDIVAKHMEADSDGVRIAEIDEMSYRKLLWDHTPITDFWRVGGGIAARLANNGIYTMGDIARVSLGEPGEYFSEDLLYSLFGVNAELLIDHAWGYEPCTIADIKAYRPQTNSLSSGQVLKEPYDNTHARLIVKEMADGLSLDLVDKGLVTNSVVLTIGYDASNLKGRAAAGYRGKVALDHYGRMVPTHAHGTQRLERYTSSGKLLTEAFLKIFDAKTIPALTVRRVTLVADNLIPEADAKTASAGVQMDFFTDYEALDAQKKAEDEALSKEKKVQQAILDIKKKFGKNAVVKGMNLEEGGTAVERNGQIGGHKA